MHRIILSLSLLIPTISMAAEEVVTIECRSTSVTNPIDLNLRYTKDRKAEFKLDSLMVKEKRRNESSVVSIVEETSQVKNCEASRSTSTIGVSCQGNISVDITITKTGTPVSISGLSSFEQFDHNFAAGECVERQMIVSTGKEGPLSKR